MEKACGCEPALLRQSSGAWSQARPWINGMEVTRHDSCRGQDVLVSATGLAVQQRALQRFTRPHLRPPHGCSQRQDRSAVVRTILANRTGRCPPADRAAQSYDLPPASAQVVAGEVHALQRRTDRRPMGASIRAHPAGLAPGHLNHHDCINRQQAQPGIVMNNAPTRDHGALTATTQ
ncbi:MAG: hypothetical protein RLZ81_1823 [Pseudomonadota bacterium]|jgi:hypothetical protein